MVNSGARGNGKGAGGKEKKKKRNHRVKIRGGGGCQGKLLFIIPFVIGKVRKKKLVPKNGGKKSSMEGGRQKSFEPAVAGAVLQLHGGGKKPKEKRSGKKPRMEDQKNERGEKRRCRPIRDKEKKRQTESL